jgi:hypothetical protein
MGNLGVASHRFRSPQGRRTGWERSCGRAASSGTPTPAEVGRARNELDVFVNEIRAESGRAIPPTWPLTYSPTRSGSG